MFTFFITLPQASYIFLGIFTWEALVKFGA